MPIDESAMTDSEWTNRFLSTAEFFALAKARLSLNTPEALTDPHVIPRHDDQDADPAVLAAIAAVRPIRTACPRPDYCARGADGAVHAAHGASCRPRRRDCLPRRQDRSS
jgi:hypothetical protein